ncbi:MAG TPA: AsmA-like C-terminal region-containing protein [Sedimentisphaerales bacterium]|nr:AsmA-like C-terminal region-containing protein [Sedimentisphaerales bacterium]HQI26836.1 AsmA-like C-terminal region-containing protein [Sedimentisphaerales bacterium]
MQQKHARRWPWAVAGTLMTMILIVLLIPAGLSSRRFASWLASKISDGTGGQADIGNLSVGWFRGIEVADFRFRATDGWAQVKIDRITTQPNYASLFGSAPGFNRTVIEKPQIEIDLRSLPATEDEEPFPFGMNDLARLNDVLVRGGSIQLTDASGKTVRLASLDSTLNMRPPGRASQFEVSTVVAQAQTSGSVKASGRITPDTQLGWSLRGTTGNITIEVNDLDLNSVAPFLAMAGVQVQAQGTLSADIQGAVQDGQIDSLNVSIVGQNLDISGQILQGDRVQTSQLNAQAAMTRSKKVLNIERLNLQTDWAAVSATGKLPTTVQSLAHLLESGSAYDLQGKFDVNLTTVLSQMPKTIGMQEGMKITGGRATGTIGTTTEKGRATLVAEAQVADLAGVLNQEKVALSKPVQAALRLSTDLRGVSRLESLNITAPFAQLTAQGDLEKIQYKGQVDLASLQSELGPFVNLGAHKIAGQVASEGQISVHDGLIGASGSLSAQQIALTTPDRNSVSEPRLNLSFAMSVNQQQQTLTVDSFSATAGFGSISVAKTAIPYGPDTDAPLNATVTAKDMNLGKLKPYAVLFASFPQDLGLDGLVQSQLTVTREKGVYRVGTNATQIQGLTLTSPEKETFRQSLITAQFDAYIDPAAKTINIAQLQVTGPQLSIRKGTLQRTLQGNEANLLAQLNTQVDLEAVGQAASVFMPGTVSLTGQRQVSLDFASTYPFNDPNGLLANLNGKTSLGFDSAEYKGLAFGPTQIDIQIEQGIMHIRPFTTTVNNGKLNFVGQVDLSKTPLLLKTTAPLQVVQGIQITDKMTGSFLQYVNPIFADAVNVRGVLDFETQSMTIPLTSGHGRTAQLDGTIGLQELRLEASLLNRILNAVKTSPVRDQTLTIRPTKIVLHNGAIRYDDMQIDLGDNPINFRGTIGLDGILDMRVLLPYTFEGRTVRIGEEGRTGNRISVPLTGTLTSPQINLAGFLQDQILGGLDELLKKLKK